MNKRLALGLATAAILALTACGIAAQPTETAPVGDNRPATTAAETTSAETSPAAEPTPSQDSGAQAFGATYAYDDGLAVTIGAPQPYEPNEYAAGTDGFTQFIVVDVTVVNHTGAPWEPALFHATLQSGNQEASSIFDHPTLVGPPTTTLLDGRETVFQLGFGVADPSNLVLEITPDFNHDSVLYVQEP